MSIFDDWNGEAWEDTGESFTPEEESSYIQDYDWGSLPETPYNSGFSDDWYSNLGNDMSSSYNDWGGDLFNNEYDLPETPYNNGTSNDWYANLGQGDGSNTWGTAGGSIKNVLSDLFTKGTMPNTIGQIGAALLSGYQNKQKANALTKASSQVDPWAAQRSYYQTQAKNTVTDPYSQPIVAAQIAKLQQAQNIKDAAAGRRSNSLLGSTAVLGEAAKIAQAYQQQMANQGGASINPAGLAQLLSGAAAANTNGYISPLANIFGQISQANANANILANSKG